MLGVKFLLCEIGEMVMVVVLVIVVMVMIGFVVMLVL